MHNLQSREEQEVRKMGRSTLNSACVRKGKTGSKLEVEFDEDGVESIQDKMNPSLNITRIGWSIRRGGHIVTVPISDVKSKKKGLPCATTSCKGKVEKMEASHVKVKLAECEETERRDHTGALIFNAKTIKEMIHNRNAGVSKSRYIGISIPIKYSNFSRFYKKNGSIL